MLQDKEPTNVDGSNRGPQLVVPRRSLPGFFTAAHQRGQSIEITGTRAFDNGRVVYRREILPQRTERT